MPKREDENWARWKEEKGTRIKPLCPFCGKGDRLYYNKHFKSWRCGWCEKSFPTPSGLTPLKDEFVEHYERQRAIPRTTFVKRTPPTSKRVSFRTRRFPWSKILLLLLLAFGIVIIVYTAYLFIDHRVSVGPVVGVAAASIIVLLWNISILRSRYRRAKPGRIIATLVAFALIGATMFAFIGVAPFSTAMDTVVDWFGMNQDSSGGVPIATLTPTPTPTRTPTPTPRPTPTPTQIPAPPATYIPSSTPTPTRTPTHISTPTPTPTSGWVGPHGETEHEILNIQGGNGQKIELFNNPYATNPTWDGLLNFLQTDTTDQRIYQPDVFVCADFAEMLHTHAEAAGIMAAYVVVELEGNPDFGNVPHALNGFNTTDRGFVYIDDTGVPIENTYPSECSKDKEVSVGVGVDYIPVSIFPCDIFPSTWGYMGTVTYIEPYYW